MGATEAMAGRGAALVTKVNAIPGAGDVIRPVADSMLEKLRAMTA